MKKITTILALALALSAAAQAQDWELKSTTAYGTGGFWENGESIRIDRSFSGGRFVSERKFSSAKKNQFYSAKGSVSGAKQSYAPGATISISVTVSSSGDYKIKPHAPYGRVTLMSGETGWTKSNWSTDKIGPTKSVSGELSDASGKTVLSPSDGQSLSATFSGRAPSSGNVMNIVVSCNDVDVVYRYERETVASASAPAEEITSEESTSSENGSSWDESSENPGEYGTSGEEEIEGSYEEQTSGGWDDEEDDSRLVVPLDDLYGGESLLSGTSPALLYGGAAALLLAILGLVAFLISKKKKAAKLAASEAHPPVDLPVFASEEPAPPQVPAEAPAQASEATAPAAAKVRFCPNCGTRLHEGAEFCGECGTKLI